MMELACAAAPHTAKDVHVCRGAAALTRVQAPWRGLDLAALPGPAAPGTLMGDLNCMLCGLLDTMPVLYR